MNVRSRLERLERSDALSGEPATFDELVVWCEQGRRFEIQPGSIWWPLWLASLEGAPTNADD